MIVRLLHTVIQLLPTCKYNNFRELLPTCKYNNFREIIVNCLLILGLAWIIGITPVWILEWIHCIQGKKNPHYIIDPHPPLCMQLCIIVWLIMQPICVARHPYVYPGTAAVNQTACSLPIKGKAFATDNHFQKFYFVTSYKTEGQLN